ncbi:isoleucine--tRNA ligase [bacterium]|jgi:isoleucyl-tRNA synthetase|nr:isoleucine--tRNA ligase [bacterium]
MSEKETIDLKKTVNLPQTEFPIRAGLVNLEPALLDQWKSLDMDQYQGNSSDSTYTLHDGPPYPNGNIHIGHALNKILKDLVIRSQRLYGKQTPYRPGWDCHGLPIETQLLKKLKKDGVDVSQKDITWFRDQCKAFSLDYVETQKKDFQRLGIWANWDNPYLTLNHDYEAKVVESFGKLAQNGLVSKGRKPIHWCPSCQTALAEAEIEHDDHRSPSITVRFAVSQASDALKAIIGDTPVDVLVWTTTPWTLPANVAIAAHPDFTYVISKTPKGTYIHVKELTDTLSTLLEWESVESLGELTGEQLKGTVTTHPLYERPSAIYNADYVTKEDGTGFVHIAPGHGQDDYIVGQQNGLPTIMPIDGKGCFTDEVPDLEGQKIFDANKTIGMALDEKGTLLKLKFIKHSYPHCWRCKNPVIFRATEQWFVTMDTPMTNGPLEGQTLREASLKTINDNVSWVPDWGIKRITAMVSGRPDWCISRQRKWGIPIPAITCQDCGHSETHGAINDAISALFAKEGAGVWFSKSLQEMLPDHTNCPKCKTDTMAKETDILDVWFESGASFASVVPNPPADMYLEGSDQHRGWFQSSLLIGLGATGQAPFKTVLTHGFIVDAKGKKMSKSLGNVISPEQIIRDYGADILRWWVASTNFKDDVSISQDILKQARDSFGKVRNTIRFLISNLYDFDYETQYISPENRETIDQFAINELHTLSATLKDDHYKNFNFHKVTQDIHHFCSVTLSANYLDGVKDCLYCEASNSPKRKSTQSTMYDLANTLIKLISPILVFTAEDAYKHFNRPDKKKSVHLEQLLTTKEDDMGIADLMGMLYNQKSTIYKDLEIARQDGTINKILEAVVEFEIDPKFKTAIDWTQYLIVSAVIITEKEGADTPQNIKISKTPHPKCQRCWRHLPVNDNTVCERCDDAISA